MWCCFVHEDMQAYIKCIRFVIMCQEKVRPTGDGVDHRASESFVLHDALMQMLPSIHRASQLHDADVAVNPHQSACVTK